MLNVYKADVSVEWMYLREMGGLAWAVIRFDAFYSLETVVNWVVLHTVVYYLSISANCIMDLLVKCQSLIQTGALGDHLPT